MRGSLRVQICWLLAGALLTCACGSESFYTNVPEDDETGDEVDQAAAEEGVRYGIVMKPDENAQPGVPWRVIAFEEIDGELIAEGDIVLEPRLLVEISEEELDSFSEGEDLEEYRRRSQELAPDHPDAYWPDARISYVIDSGLPNQERVHDAIAHLEEHTPLEFVEIERPPRWRRIVGAITRMRKDYVRFIKKEGVCNSRVGRVGGEQDINLSDNCSTDSVVHELLHASGVWHEQSRPDRDQHIEIHWDNIPEDKQHNFKIFEYGGWFSEFEAVTDYDVTSIMHYRSYAFSKNGEPTITKLDGSPLDSKRQGLSERDIEGLNKIYGSSN